MAVPYFCCPLSAASGSTPNFRFVPGKLFSIRSGEEPFLEIGPAVLGLSLPLTLYQGTLISVAPDPLS